MTASAPPGAIRLRSRGRGGGGGRPAATGVLDGGEYAPSSSVELIAMSREMVANRRIESESRRVTGVVGSRVNNWASAVEMSRRSAGTAAGEEIAAGVTMDAAQLRLAVGNQRARTMPAPGDGGGAS